MRHLLLAPLLLLCLAVNAHDGAISQPAATATGNHPRPGGADAPGTGGAMFRGDAAHTGAYNAAGTTAFHRLKWRFQSKAQILSSPAVSGDTVYFRSNDHRLYAVDLATGEKKWEFKTDGRVASIPLFLAAWCTS